MLAVDVGYGQFDWTLRNDPRVTVMERTNVRRLTREDLPFQPDLLVADLSFISLTVALESILSTTPTLREAILLVKPQFEAGPESVGRAGLVRDREVHAAVIRNVARYFGTLGFGAVGATGGRRRKEVGQYRVPGSPAQGSGAGPGRGANQRGGRRWVTL